MPYLFDFSKCIGDIKTIAVQPKGWVQPLFVEYGTVQRSPYDTQLSVVWRVKGTTHTFAIYERRINVMSHGNYKEHFEEALSNFRLDYLSWFEDEDYKGAAWVDEYRQQYGKYIISDASKNNQSKS